MEGAIGTGMIEAFTGQFGAPPTHLVRAPGRVNLIGEHIDYHQLPVLPMAIDREIRLLVRPRDDAVVCAMTLADSLPVVAFELSECIPSADAGDWSNYLRGAAQSLVRKQGATRGLDVLVDSTLPMAAGMSSSSALAVGAGLAIAGINGFEIDRRMFAIQMAEAERYSGTQGGGMDQAVCLLAEPGCALYVDFQPLEVRPIPLPSGLQIIVAHSLKSAQKSGPARAAYNELRLTGEHARKSVAKALGLPSGTGYDRLIDVGEAGLHVATKNLSGPALCCFRHVITEALRVTAAVSALENSELSVLGKLLDASHESLRSDLQVSTPELDELVTLARGAGALGARLTGAGFGGAMIALAPSEQAETIRQVLARRFYHPRGISEPEKAGFLGDVTASRGAQCKPVAD